MNPKSAATSLNQVPSLHKFVATLNLSLFDFGAGKKGKIDEFYTYQQESRPVFFYDPFNRSPEENKKSLESLDFEEVDVLTCANVLNVLEDEYLDRVIAELADLTKQTNKETCFVSVYHNPRLPKNRMVRGYFQRNEPIAWYVEKLQKRFDKVSKIGNFLMCRV